MPGIHSPFPRHFFTLDGSVLTSGGAKNLAKGQFTIVTPSKVGENGALVVSSFAGKSDAETYEMRLGTSKFPAIRTFPSSKPYSSEVFKIKDVVDVKAHFPRVSEQKFDDYIVGYNGISADSAIELEEDMTTVLDVVLWGEPVMYKTGKKEHVIKIHFGKDGDETNEEMIQRAVENLKSQTLPGDIPITELVDISQVNSESVAPSGEAYVFSSLTLVDEGDSNSLARVQAQYPDYQVLRTSRSGLQSIYSILHPVAEELDDYSAVTNAMYIKNCEDCIAGYSEVAGGFVYSISVEDDGADLSTTVDNIAGFQSGTVIRHGNKNGRGIYTLITDDQVTEAEIATYVASTAVLGTATVTLLGEVSDVCTDTDTVTTAWVDGDTCYASVEAYTIQLRDNECGESRLAELQAYYPDLTIEEGNATGAATQAVTLSGSSGAGTITVGGEAYTVNYATSLTATAAAFVTANAADILSDHGVTVTANAAVLTFTGQGEGFPSISFANTSGTLAGAVAAIDYTTTATTGACQRVYSTQVTTNIVCDECDPILTEQFTSEPPADYDFTSWRPLLPTFSENALMGIRITGKPFYSYPTDVVRDQIPFYETSTRISIAGGYVEEVNFSFDPQYNDIFEVKRLSMAEDRDNLGGHLMQWEDLSRAYFQGHSRHKDNQFARVVYGEESVLKYTSQYVQFEVTIRDNKYSQGLGRSSDMATTYIIVAELGYHQNLENYINSLAARAGLEGTRPVV
jgi:hypothetical protein